MPAPAPATFGSLWDSLLPLGRDPGTGGYRRFSWTPADLDCRAWFEAAARDRQLRTDQDRNGNLWAWWDAARARARRSPPGAIWTRCRTAAPTTGRWAWCPPSRPSTSSGPTGFAPARPIAVAAFTEEEGGRFGVACLGSRLLTGAIDPETARGLRDGDGTTLADGDAGGAARTPG